MCGGTMLIKETKHVIAVPGNPTPTTKVTGEWNCPDCDYFEEAEEEST